MKILTITPLLITAAIFFLMAIWVPFAPDGNSMHLSGVGIPWIMPLLLVIGALITWGADRLIQKRAIELKKIWVIESLIVIIMLLYAIFMK